MNECIYMCYCIGDEHFKKYTFTYNMEDKRLLVIDELFYDNIRYFPISVHLV